MYKLFYLQQRISTIRAYPELKLENDKVLHSVLLTKNTDVVNNVIHGPVFMETIAGTSTSQFTEKRTS